MTFSLSFPFLKIHGYNPADTSRGGNGDKTNGVPNNPNLSSIHMPNTIAGDCVVLPQSNLNNPPSAPVHVNSTSPNNLRITSSGSIGNNMNTMNNLNNPATGPTNFNNNNNNNYGAMNQQQYQNPSMNQQQYQSWNESYQPNMANVGNYLQPDDYHIGNTIDNSSNYYPSSGSRDMTTTPNNTRRDDFRNNSGNGSGGWDDYYDNRNNRRWDDRDRSRSRSRDRKNNGGNNRRDERYNFQR